MDDETQHQVTITRGFCLKATEVTQGEWSAFFGGNPAYFTEFGSLFPVEMVSWFDSIFYCNALSAKEGLQECYTVTGPCTQPSDCWNPIARPQYCYGSSCTGVTFAGPSCTGYRLPTEAEWEYAARAGTTTATYNGTDLQVGLNWPSSYPVACTEPDTVLDPIAWWCGNDDYNTMPVAERLPNAYGLYDMFGNVAEWVSDVYGPYPTVAVTDPLGNTAVYDRVLRGGGFGTVAVGLQAAKRGHFDPSSQAFDIGFRPARSVTP
jgi:formylglycine-generating enzyme required for sulfatase activity